MRRSVVRVFIQQFKIRVIATAVGAPFLFLLGGCFSTEVLRFKSPSRLDINQDYYLNTYIGGGWYGPNQVDYARSTASVNNAATTVGAYEIAGSATGVTLMGTFCLTASCTGAGDFGLMTLDFKPYTLKGSGWGGTHSLVENSLNSAADIFFAPTADRSYATFGYIPQANAETDALLFHANLSTGVETLLTAHDFTGGRGVDALFPAGGLSFGWAGSSNLFSGLMDGGVAYAYRWTLTPATPAYALSGAASTNTFALSPSATEVHLHSDGASSVALMKIAHLAPAGTLNKAEVDPASVKIAAGFDFSCMLVAGEVWCAGLDTVGQLGDGDSDSDADPLGEDSTSFVKVTGLDGIQIQEISAGNQHICALTTAGEIYCWGEGSAGQLGNNAMADSGVPVAVVDSNGSNVSGMTGVSAGEVHTCALALTGSIYCWGAGGVAASDTDRLLGTGTADGSTTLGTAVINYTDFIEVKAAEGHSCGVRADRSVVCWGLNADGRLGNATMVSPGAPALVTGSATASTLTLGQTHSCLSDGAGNAKCAGSDASLQLGDSAAITANQSTPVAVTNLTAAAALSGVLEIKSGLTSTCARKADKTLVCWGEGSAGELGNAAVADSGIPVTVSNVTQAVHLSEGWAAGHHCSVDQLGKIFCWGDNTVNGDGKMGSGPSAGYNPLGTPAELTVDYLACPVDQTAATLPAPTTRCLRVLNLDADGVRSGARTLSTQWVTPTHDSGNAVESYTQATDEAGTLLVAFLAKDPTVVSCSVTNCDVRPYVAVKNANGVWSNPSRIDQSDVPFTTGYSTAYVDTAAYLVTDYPVPQIAYLGSGQFLAVYVMADTVGNTTYVMGRIYTVGSGWSTSSIRVDAREVITYGGVTEGRAIHDLKILSGGSGTAVVALRPTTDAGALTLEVTSYSAGLGWTATTAIKNYSCDVAGSPASCLDLEARAHFVNYREGVMLFKGGDLKLDSLAATERLWSIEFHRD